MQDNIIITFANQKGGVGKTTLCTLFANYLVGHRKKVLVIDCDVQQTISFRRKADLQKYKDAMIPYNIAETLKSCSIDHKSVADIINAIVRTFIEQNKEHLREYIKSRNSLI